MPPEKRTKTGNVRGGRKEDRPKKRGAVSKKRRSPTLLVAWVLAVFFLATLIYFAEKSQRLPAPSADLTQESSRTESAPEGPQIEGSSPKNELPQVAERPQKAPEKPFSRSDNLGGPPPKQDNPPIASAPKVLPPPRPGGVPLPDISPKSSRVSIVIDDFGPDIGIARQFVSLPFPVTLSVLPHQAHSREIAELAHQAGREVILHLPMEPLDSRQNPGRGALMLSMSGDEIRRNIKAALDASPFFDGVSNHMGSRMTRDAQTMKTVLLDLKARNLFFIDSMTTNESTGWKDV